MHYQLNKKKSRQDNFTEIVALCADFSKLAKSQHKYLKSYPTDNRKHKALLINKLMLV